MHYALTSIEKDDKFKIEELLKSCLTQESEVHIMGSLAKHWLDEGIEKGIEKGEQKGRVETAKEMLRDGMAIEKIAKFTKLPVEQIAALAAEIKQTK
jgi:predicted transposase/invertase (TIGR01784 family)